MAVYTHLPDNVIKSMIQQEYGLQVREVNPVAEGIENSIYKLTSVSGVSFAFVIFEEVSVSLVERYCRIFDAVSRELKKAALTSITVPAGLALLQPEDGRLFTSIIVDEVSGLQKPAVLQPWIEGTAVKPSEQLCLQLGQFLGVVNGIPPVERQACQNLPMNQHLLRIDKVQAQLGGMDTVVQDQFWKFKSLVSPVIEVHSTLQYGLIHGDLFSDNALALGDALTGVIDFFNASWSPLLLDLAICLMDWCYQDGMFHEPRTHAFLQGFREKCEPLPSFDQQYWPELVQLAAFRFWCTRQEYYLACQKRGIAPVVNRDPIFCAQVFDQVSKQEGFLRRALVK